MGSLDECPIWSFDGSSTKQAPPGESSVVEACSNFPDPPELMDIGLLTEVLNSDGTPHESNGEAQIDDDDNDFWFGFEQEYFIMDVETQLH